MDIARSARKAGRIGIRIRGIRCTKDRQNNPPICIVGGVDVGPLGPDSRRHPGESPLAGRPERIRDGSLGSPRVRSRGQLDDDPEVLAPEPLRAGASRSPRAEATPAHGGRRARYRASRRDTRHGPGPPHPSRAARSDGGRVHTRRCGPARRSPWSRCLPRRFPGQARLRRVRSPPRATRSVKAPPMSTPTRVRPDPASLITAARARCPATRRVRPAALEWPAPPRTRADPTPAPRSLVRPPAR